jgi:hypothetical protein
MWLALLSAVLVARPASGVCTGEAPHLVVLAAEHRLWLCDGTQSRGSFSVRLARRGPGKTAAGDGKLPLGSYGLGPPRVSKSYGIFIPIRYPTPAQASRGYSGRDVGVHGPGRAVRWLGRLANLFDTTDGCVGLASDAEMREIAAWVKARRVRRIELR